MKDNIRPGTACSPDSNCINFERVSYSLIEEPEVCEWCVYYDEGICRYPEKQ